MTNGWSDIPANYDPNDPNTWSPEQRVDYLTRAGFNWAQGNGSGALWTAPNGEPMNELAAFTAIAKGTVPAPPRTAASSVDRSGQIGRDPSTGDLRYFTYGNDGQPIWGPLAPPTNSTPGHSTSSSYNVSQSYQDPAALALQQRQLDFQIQDAQQKLAQAQQAQDWQQVYQQQQLLQQATLQRESLAQQAQLATQGQQAQAALQQNAQGFTALQNANAQGASATESANSRALQAAEFAQTQEANRAGLQLQADTTNAQGEAQASRDRLAAADQYAKLVSSTDTAALPAYLAAGGGVLWNAKANPNAPSLLTDNAINPAASSLRDARTIAWKPITVAPTQGFQQPTYQTFTPQAYTPGQAAQSIPGNQPSGFNPNNPNTTWMPGSGPLVPNRQDPGYAVPSTNTGSSGPNGPAGGNLSVDANGNAVGFAGGTGYGFIPAPHQGFMTSEGGPEFMRVIDPPGANNARIMVVPHAQSMGMVRGFAGGTMIPGYADGTDPSADPTQVGVDPNGLDPYAAEVRSFRQNFNAPQYGFSQFDPRFSRQLSQGMQDSYFMGQQTQSGVPAEANAFQSAYYTPVGYKSSPYRVTPDLAY